jgi:hypothetical protein
MAKVTGPLMSISASGKLANSLVFFGWKGLNVVRQWLIPANPMSASQGNFRTMLAGTGKAVGKIETDGEIAAQLISQNLIPAGQTKQSYLVKYILTNYLTNPTTYASQLALATGHTAWTSFQGLADLLTVVNFDLSYDTIATYDKGFGLYLIAKAGIALGLTGTPWTTALTSWTKAHVYSMGKDFTGV